MGMPGSGQQVHRVTSTGAAVAAYVRPERQPTIPITMRNTVRVSARSDQRVVCNKLGLVPQERVANVRRIHNGNHRWHGFVNAGLQSAAHRSVGTGLAGVRPGNVNVRNRAVERSPTSPSTGRSIKPGHVVHHRHQPINRPRDAWLQGGQCRAAWVPGGGFRPGGRVRITRA